MTDMRQRITGLIVAGLLIIVGAQIYAMGYNQGAKDEETRQATELVRRHLAYWRINDGEAVLEYRYVPRVQETCVKFGGDDQ